MGITDTDVRSYIPRARAWIDQGNHLPPAVDGRTTTAQREPRPAGARHPAHYLPAHGLSAQPQRPHRGVKDPTKAYIARYALGRDYHKTLRKRIALLGDFMRDWVRRHRPEEEILYRAFVDSAPIMERPLAEKAGLGWIGKNSLIIHPKPAVFSLRRVVHQPASAGGSCTCRQPMRRVQRLFKHICPTDAFRAPYELQTERCIAYLTIENKGPIPLDYREAIGNRVFGCDDCQAICPWNKFAGVAQVGDFAPRHQLDQADLLSLFNWDEAQFLHHTQGSALRRIDYRRFCATLPWALATPPATPPSSKPCKPA